MNTKAADDVIIGRVDPCIYAFSTSAIPNYLKVGDTYRGVSVRLQEWRECFPDLKKEFEAVAIVDGKSTIFFRDFSVHDYLITDKQRKRLEKKDVSSNIHYSKEFFEGATIQDVKEAIEDIKQDYKNNTGRYSFYDAETCLPETYTYIRSEEYSPRPNQKKTIERFVEAVNKGRTNLLMYAVMRFGKSFTSMCCALKMDAKMVCVVSAKADVKEEWKKTVESHQLFKDYVFFTSENLLADEELLSKSQSDGKKVVLFLTLQDLLGENVKKKHQELFSCQIDLLIVDETHFAARAEKMGQVLREPSYEKDVNNKVDLDDSEDLAAINEQIKYLKAHVKLHLSGTPYRILMGNEFSKEDIIAFYQFSNIVQDQKEWIRQNTLNEDSKEEWDNPYYGFPQMIRFAFNPNESSLKRIKELRTKGYRYAFSALFKPKSIKKAPDDSHKKFIYEKEILDFLSVIDGSKEDDGILGFLDYSNIKKGQMCRHIVCVLPYCASCDAMETLIKENHKLFKNLQDYEIINISGIDKTNLYKDSASVKRKVAKCEEQGKKTLTLTVNRMLTGSTVEQWDTMIFLKDTVSPQEYDQAIFRLQNQYIKKYTDNNGNVIKRDMKPQTLLVDFDPARMFSMQEQKALIYNINVDKSGNSNLEDRIQEELQISPIIVANSNKMEQVVASDIIKAISEYSKERGVAEETLEIPVDLSLLKIKEIREAIEKENEIGAKSGFTIKSNEGEGTEIDIPGENSGLENANATNEQTENDFSDKEGNSSAEEKNPEKQFRTYYARILFYSFLTNDVINSLEELISHIDNPDNQRIARNLGLSKNVLMAINNNINYFTLRDLDYKIYNLNKLSHDTSISPLERASVAINKFGKLGESEVITPQDICAQMVENIPDDGFNNIKDGTHCILDLAGKAGEFPLALYKKLILLGYTHEDLRDSIITIPTSGITYEFTRFVYNVLGLNTDNIAEKITTYDLLNVKDDDGKNDFNKVLAILKQDKPFNEISITDQCDVLNTKRKFEVILGNPPYQENVSKAKGNKSLGKQLFPRFIYFAVHGTDRYVSLLTPTKWFTSIGQDGSFPVLREFAKNNNHFRSIRVFNEESSIFQGVAVESVSSFLYDKLYTGNVLFDDGASKVTRPLFEKDIDIIIQRNLTVGIIEKVRQSKGFVPLTTITNPRNVFGVSGKKDTLVKNTMSEPFRGAIKVRCAHEKIRYISKDKITKKIDLIESWKVFISKANGAAGVIETNKANAIIGKGYIGEPNSVCTDSLIAIGKFSTKKEAQNLQKYLSTKFLRFMVGTVKSTRNLYQPVYALVPIQDFTEKSILNWETSVEDLDKQLYRKYNLSKEEIDVIEKSITAME